ncbi:MAG: 7,8-didemethyl-8-hydroxy-5-deazariboflavin synthase subunit CofG [Nodosilinea sp. LVE1205-7]|jgi:FO synthase subunit 1
MVTPITYSPAYTLVPTYECFNRCTYCNFRVDLGQAGWIDGAQARSQIEIAQSQGVIEVLIMSGEVAPHSPQRQDWFNHIYQLCELVLEVGLIPHTNVGPLSHQEMARLQQVNGSMGLMLEQLTPDLLQTVHRHAPSKHPQVRLQQLAQAGELQIPFTTGLLLGLGETEADWRDALVAIANLHQRYGHIQEVILQPHSPGQRQLHPGQPLATQQLLQALNLAREHLPAAITLQVPPNLIDQSSLLAALAAGARDLGGLSPVDEVNPDYNHPQPAHLARTIAPAGWQLQPRLPVYPQYDDWLPPALRSPVRDWRRRLTQAQDLQPAALPLRC